MERWRGWTAGWCGEMAWMDSWLMWRDGVDGQLLDVERWHGWTAGWYGEMAWMDSWLMWRDGMDGQLVDVEIWHGWTASGCGEMAWMYSWWMWRDGVDGIMMACNKMSLQALCSDKFKWIIRDDASLMEWQAHCYLCFARHRTHATPQHRGRNTKFWQP